MKLLDRCTARDDKETAKDIEAEVTARLDPLAFSEAKATFRAFHASWEGSIAVAICAYLDASKDTALAEIRAERDAAKADIETFWKPQFDEQCLRAEAAESELALVKKALEPFAKIDRQMIQGHLSGHIDDDNEVFVRVGDIRAAADALSASRATSTHEGDAK